MQLTPFFKDRIPGKFDMIPEIFNKITGTTLLMLRQTQKRYILIAKLTFNWKEIVAFTSSNCCGSFLPPLRA